MKVRRYLFVAALALLYMTYQSQGASGEQAIQASLQAVLDEQVKAWNEGNIEKFMGGYHRADTTRFASDGDISRGWQTVFERYKTKYSDRAAMGKLAFSDLETTVLSADAALVFGRWSLEREKDKPSGLFTLLFRKTPEGWRIVHDHTSAATKN